MKNLKNKKLQAYLIMGFIGVFFLTILIIYTMQLVN